VCQSRLSKFTTSHIKSINTVHTRPKQSRGLDHQLWQLEVKVTLVAFNHRKEKSLILYNNWCRVLAEPRNNLWFLSVQTAQAQASQMSCIKERRAREPPAEEVNWTRWSRREVCSTTGVPIHERTNAERGPKVPHTRNKWWAESTSPQPETHNWAVVGKMPRATRFAFVGNLLRNKRQAKMDTFNEIWGCQMSFSASSMEAEVREVKSWYAPRTVYPLSGSGCHCHLSENWSCNKTVRSNDWHSINSSSHSLGHTQAARSASHHKENISATEHCLVSAKTNRRPNRSHKGVSST
jgi:hypothetical protein